MSISLTCDCQRAAAFCSHPQRRAHIDHLSHGEEGFELVLRCRGLDLHRPYYEITFPPAPSPSCSPTSRARRGSCRNSATSYGRSCAEHRRLVREAFDGARRHRGRHAGRRVLLRVPARRDAVAAAVDGAARARGARVAATAAQVRVRMGLHTGEPAVGERAGTSGSTSSGRRGSARPGTAARSCSPSRPVRCSGTTCRRRERPRPRRAEPEGHPARAHLPARARRAAGGGASVEERGRREELNRDTNSFEAADLPTTSSGGSSGASRGRRGGQALPAAPMVASVDGYNLQDKHTGAPGFDVVGSPAELQAEVSGRPRKTTGTQRKCGERSRTRCLVTR